MRHSISNFFGGMLILAITCVSSFCQSLPAGCTQRDPNHIVCKKSNGPLPSGTGKKFGQYWGIQSGDPPSGYRLESASFDLEGPHPCKGNDASPVQPPKPSGPGTWKDVNPPGPGKRHGAGSWADCWQESRDDDHVKWEYTVQGTEGQTSLLINGNGVGWETGPDDVVKEPATLGLVYVKR